MELVTKYFNFLLALLAIINPIAVAPFFVALTHHQSPVQRNQTARTAATAVAIILLVCFLVGEAILKLFGIQLSAFRVAGGLLLLLMGLNSAQGKGRPMPPPQEGTDIKPEEEEEDIAVVPLALPLTTGPGTISAVIVYGAANRALSDLLASVVMTVLIALIVYLSYLAAPWLAKRLGRTGMHIAYRISGLILASLGVQFIVLGVAELLQPLLK